MAVKEVYVDKNVEQPNKVLDILGYLIFIIPLVTMKNEFDRYHANQATILAICTIVLNFALGIFTMIPLLGWILGPILMLVGNIGAIVFMVIGMMNASKLECKPLPLIGNLFQVVQY